MQDKKTKKVKEKKPEIIKEKKQVKTEKKKKEDSPKIFNLKFDILAIVCIILFCAVLAPVGFQNDTFYTIKIGEHIVNNGIDMQDPFSWHEGLPYVYPHWLYDTLTYLIYSFSGLVGLFFTTMILSCVLGITMYKVNKQVSKNRLISFILTLGTMYLFEGYIAARAQLVTFILFEFEILFIERFLDKKKIRYGIGLVILSLLIANLHCAVWPFFFVLFLPYLAEYILQFNYIKLIKNIKVKFVNYRLKKCKNKDKENALNELLKKINEDYERLNAKIEKRRKNPYKIRMEKRDAVKWLILIMVICSLMGLITPIGDTPYTYLYKTMQGNTTKSISEHLPLTLINDKPLMIVLAAIIFLHILTDVKFSVKDIFMISGLIVLTFMSRRQQSMFLLIGSAIVAKWIAELVDKYDKDGTKEFMKIMLSTLGMIATILVITLFMVLKFKGKITEPFINESAYPVEASNYIVENLDVENMRLYNEYNYGSYLLFRDIPVFIDSRADLYAPEYNKTERNPEGIDIFSDYISASNISKYYEDIFDKYNITHIILNNKAKVNMLIKRDITGKYESLYEDSYFVVYKYNK